MRDLGCVVEGVTYNPTSRSGTLTMRAGDSCDMEACIDRFKLLAKVFGGADDVRRIQTFSGEEPDTLYTSDDGEHWTAYPTEGGVRGGGAGN